jgi:hypothetical protein
VASFIAVSSGGGDGGAPDLPPGVEFIGVAEFVVDPEGNPSPYEIKVRYRITNEDEGELSARVEAQRVNERGEPDGDLVEAVPLPGSDPLDDICPDKERTFLWDVGETPGFEDGSTNARILIAASEDGRE